MYRNMLYQFTRNPENWIKYIRYKLFIETDHPHSNLGKDLPDSPENNEIKRFYDERGSHMFNNEMNELDYFVCSKYLSISDTDEKIINKMRKLYYEFEKKGTWERTTPDQMNKLRERQELLTYGDYHVEIFIIWMDLPFNFKKEPAKIMSMKDNSTRKITSLKQYISFKNGTIMFKDLELF